MKKYFCLILGIFLSITMASFLGTKPTVFANEYTVQKLEISMDAKFEDNQYFIEFNPFTDPHYSAYTIDLTIQTNPNFDGLLPSVQKEIVSDITWNISGTQIEFYDFDNRVFECNDFVLIINEYSGCLTFQPIKAKTYQISCGHPDGQDSNTIAVVAEYAIPDEITITPNGQTEQFYESFNTITLNTEFNYSEFIDKNLSCEYSWYKKSTDPSNKISGQTSSSLTITKDLIEIGKIQFIVVAKFPNSDYMTKNIELNIQTNEKIPVELKCQGNLEQELNESSTPISLKVEAPISNYTVVWYVQSPDSDIYQTKDWTNSSITFNPLDTKYVSVPGTYRLFAKIIVGTNTSITDIITMNFTKHIEPETITFTITEKEYNSEKTGLNAYELSINTQGIYDDKKVVWMIGDLAYSTGSHIFFEEEFAGEYIVKVYLLGDDGLIDTQKLLATTNLSLESVQQTQMPIYIGIAGGVLIIICTLSIIVSNKKREKIW